MTSKPKKAVSILVADKDSRFLESISNASSIREAGWEVRVARDADEAMDKLGEAPADMLVANLDLPKETGDVLLSNAKRDYPN